LLSAPVRRLFGCFLNDYDARGIHRVQFSPKMFSYGRNKFAEKIPNNLGFAGFRLAFSLLYQEIGQRK
jgi:glucan biosynthesis protein